MPKKPRSVKARIIEDIGDGTNSTRNIELERSLLATCMSSHEKLRLTTSLISRDHFSDPRHKVVYDVAVNLDEKGKRPYANIVLAEILKRPDDDIEPDDFKAAFDSIASSEKTDIEAACRVVHDLYVARRLQSISHEVISRASAGEDIHELIEELESNVKGISHSSFDDEHLIDLDITIANTIKGSIGIIEPASTGIKTPFPDLNDLIYGLRPGDVTVVGARPGVGKTVFLAQIAYHAAKNGNLTMFYAHEMSSVSVWRRLMCAENSVRNTDVNTLELSAEEKAKCKDWLENKATRYLHVSDRGGRTPAAVRSDLIRKISKYGPVGIVVIDYLQLMHSGKGHMKRNDEVTDIIRALKQIAKDLQVHVLIASAMNREVEKRQGKDKRPQLSDLNESGNIEADASVVIFPWRPSMFHTNPNSPPPDDELIVVKNREGRTGSVKVRYRGEYFRFDNFDV